MATGETRASPTGAHRHLPRTYIPGVAERSGITEGSVFRPINRHQQIGATALRAESVSTIIKEAAQRAGLDPAKFAGHRLRAGLATAAAEADVSEGEIMAQGDWKSLANARTYIRRGSLFKRNADSKGGRCYAQATTHERRSATTHPSDRHHRIACARARDDCVAVWLLAHT
jgi:hypothetical protein